MPIQFPETVCVSNQIELRSLTLQDALPLWILTDANRDYLNKWMPWADTTRTPDDSRHFVQGAILFAKQRREMHWGIFFDGLLVGLIGLHRIDWDDFSATLGYWLSEDQQKKGIMTTTIRTLPPILHNDLFLKTIEIHVAEKNISSIEVAKRSGFTYVETIPNAEKIGDHWKSHLVFRHQNQI